MTQREVMEVDVLIVGAGPAGLSAACRLAQIAKKQQQELNICVLEKGSEVGAHLMSGAVLEPRALAELFPDWKEKGAPLKTPVSNDAVYLMTGARGAIRVPQFLCPKTMHNHGNYIVSIGEFCRWLAQEAEQLGVSVLPNFPAASIIYEDATVKGVVTTDMGRDNKGNPRQGFEPGVEVRAKYTLFAEGSRGHLGKDLIKYYNLGATRDPQHYALGIKEIWEVSEKQHKPGMVVHTIGWPLSQSKTSGGGFLYHADNRQVYVGLITDLDYANPYLSPYDEFQRYKHHPVISRHIKGGKRTSYGARAITKGGWLSLPRSFFPGGLLIGCNAGTLNFAKIKGIHMAMKSGMLAAETVATALQQPIFEPILGDYSKHFQASWAGDELYRARNVSAIQKHYGYWWGAMRNYIEINILKGRPKTDYACNREDRRLTGLSKDHIKIKYPKPDNKLSFDKNSSVFLSNTNHEENQPCHLQLKDANIPVTQNLPQYDEPAQRYCPAGVYEVLRDTKNKPYFQINAQNCVHCKTCDIKDPADNIDWIPPEGGGGPNYSNM